MDTFKFFQFLAKIAHCFAVDCLGDNFEPSLPDFIRAKEPSPRSDFVGGIPDDLPPSENLHELALEWRNSRNLAYAVVKIRLFANLGMPTYLVVAGKAKNSLPAG